MATPFETQFRPFIEASRTMVEIDDAVPMPGNFSTQPAEVIASPEPADEKPTLVAYGKAPQSARPREERQHVAEVPAAQPEAKATVAWGKGATVKKADPKPAKFEPGKSGNSASIVNGGEGTQQAFEAAGGMEAHFNGTGQPSQVHTVEPLKEGEAGTAHAGFSEYRDMRDFALYRAGSLTAKSRILLFVPTAKGTELFGWKTTLLSYKLLSFTEASAIKNSCALAELGPNFKLLGSIEIVETGTDEMNGQPATYNYRFDASQFVPEQMGSAHAPGVFNAIISNVELKQNNAANGMNYVVEFQSDGGTIKKYYSLFHENQDTARKAHNQLSALCHATGVPGVDFNDGGQSLRGARCQIEVGPQPPTEDGKVFMEIKKIMDMQGNAPGAKSTATGQLHNAQGGATAGNFGGGPQQNNATAGGFGGGGQGGGQGGGGFGGQQQNGPQGGGFGGGGQPQGGGFGGQPQGGGFGGQGGGQQGQGPQGGGFGGPAQGGGFGGGQGGGQQGQGGFNQQSGNAGGGAPSWTQN